MEHDVLNQQHLTQCYAIALIKSHGSLLVVGKSSTQTIKGLVKVSCISFRAVYC